MKRETFNLKIEKALSKIKDRNNPLNQFCIYTLKVEKEDKIIKMKNN